MLGLGLVTYFWATHISGWPYFEAPNLTVGLSMGLSGKESTCNVGDLEMEAQVPSLGWEDPLEEEMATHCSILAWRILWTEEPSGPQSMEIGRASCRERV